MSLSKLRIALSNVQSQLIIEKLSSLTNDNKLKSLEDPVVKIGYDPKDCKAVKEILKKKNSDIAALQKQLKLPSTEDPQTKEIEESEQNREEILKLIIENNIQIKKMEEQIEGLLKEKESTQHAMIQGESPTLHQQRLNLHRQQGIQ